MRVLALVYLATTFFWLVIALSAYMCGNVPRLLKLAAQSLTVGVVLGSLWLAVGCAETLPFCATPDCDGAAGAAGDAGNEVLDETGGAR